MKKIKLQADVTNGIYVVDSFDENFDELTAEHLVHGMLSEDFEGTIYAEVSKKTIKNIIEDGYSIC